MSALLFSLVLLACPLLMGAMMWWMSRGSKKQPQAASAAETELVRMRAEIDQLQAAQRDGSTAGR